MLCDWHCPDFAIEVTREPVPERTASDQEQASVTAALKTAHKLSGTRRELPPDAEPRGSKES